MAMGVKKRIGVHVGTAGGAWTAVDRAVAAGANTFQIFSSSPRQWRAAVVKPADAVKMRELPDQPVQPDGERAGEQRGGVSGRGGEGAGAGGGVSGAASGELEGVDAR